VAGVLRAAALVVALAEAGPEPEGRPAGPRRSRAPRLHRDHVEPTVADRQSPTEGLRPKCSANNYSYSNSPVLQRPVELAQFRSRKFVEQLKEFGIIESMGWVGACADNAGMESFFSLLQKNVLNRQRWRTRQELRLAIATWIERTYHRRRRQRRLGRLTPIEFEIINSQAAHVA
jgi:transposase InsO family protein